MRCLVELAVTEGPWHRPVYRRSSCCCSVTPLTLSRALTLAAWPALHLSVISSSFRQLYSFFTTYRCYTAASRLQGPFTWTHTVERSELVTCILWASCGEWFLVMLCNCDPEYRSGSLPYLHHFSLSPENVTESFHNTQRQKQRTDSIA